ncbi:MAG TPA: ribonuclease HII [Gemmatimonadaceae bacterium]|nr:ribonuclease HII [Gemmatimonadaceae bacterium]
MRWSRIERDLRAQGHELIAGVDEVGRGPLAGPVVACAVIMPPGARAISGVADSKALSGLQRRRLAPMIRTRAVAWALGAASVREIERLNILAATCLAIRRAVERLPSRYDVVLLDGRPLAGLGIAHTAVVDADARCYSVACASIVAKVVRDRLMTSLADRHPGYGWERNAGYGTAAHLAGLRRLGSTAHHRALFCATALSDGRVSSAV